jgi:SAM-dependent methyltransferase
MVRFLARRPQPDPLDEITPPASELKGYTDHGPLKGRKGFRRAGKAFLRTAVDNGLRPEHRVLDIGCGVGRLAVAVSAYLNDEGRYVGIDVEQDAIRTCNRWIGSKRPGLSFVWADVRNTSYNPDADARAAAYKLPFVDGAFDFAFSNSLFTHLVPADARNYYHEIGRVLDLGGRTLNTMFLLNEESLGFMGDGSSRHGVLHELDAVARVKDPETPEAWIGFDEQFVREAHSEAGLQIEKVRYGGWSGREPTGPGFGQKDMVVAVKEPLDAADAADGGTPPA